MASNRDNNVVWVEDQESLEALGERMMRFHAFSLDTEQDAFHAYRPKICLIQIRCGGVEYAVDALRLNDLSALAVPLADKDRVTIAHAAENDVDLLRRGFGLQVRGLFDTMAAAHRLGYKRCGLARLVETHFDVVIDKKYQRSDWRKRPLSGEQIAYAARDVRFLPCLYRILSAELAAAGETKAANADFRRIERAEHTPKRARIDDYRRIAGFSELRPVEREIFRLLFALRQRVASQDDRALFRVCGNQPLIAIAMSAPTNMETLSSIRGVPSRFKKKQGEQVLALVHAALKRAERSSEPARRIATSSRRRAPSRRAAATPSD